MTTLQYKSYPVRLHCERYSNKRPAIQLILANDTEEAIAGELITTATVNLPNEPIHSDEIAVKSYSENEGMLDWLWHNNIIERQPTRYIPSGFVRIPICKLTPAGKLLCGVKK